MGIDGLTIANLSIKRDVPSSQLSLDANILANMRKDDMIVDVDQFAKNQQISRKEENYGEDVANQSFSGGDTETTKEPDSQYEQQPDAQGQPAKRRYTVKTMFNGKMVKLIDNKEKKIVQKLPAQDLIDIISKLGSASGIIINQKV